MMIKLLAKDRNMSSMISCFNFFTYFKFYIRGMVIVGGLEKSLKANSWRVAINGGW